MVRFGFQPALASTPMARASSISATMPLTGSAAPLTQRVVVVAAQDPLVGQLAALQRGDDVVGRGQLPVELQLQVDAGRAGADVVGERQRAAPGRRRRRRRRSALQQRLRIGVGDRQHRDLHQRRRFLERRPLGVLGGADAGRQRIARIHRQVHHRAALRRAIAAPAARGVDVALEEAVVARIRVDQAADRAVLGRDLRLDAAPRAAVAGDDDLALDVDAAALELLVVGRDAVVDVDELGGHVAVGRVDVVTAAAPLTSGSTSRPRVTAARSARPRTSSAPPARASGGAASGTAPGSR